MEEGQSQGHSLWEAQVNPHKPKTLKPKPETLNSQPSTLTEPSTLNPQPYALNPEPSTLNPQPSTLKPRSRPRRWVHSFSRYLLRIAWYKDMSSTDMSALVSVGCGRGSLSLGGSGPYDLRIPVYLVINDSV